MFQFVVKYIVNQKKGIENSSRNLTVVIFSVWRALIVRVTSACIVPFANRATYRIADGVSCTTWFTALDKLYTKE